MNLKPEQHEELRLLVDAMCENTITDQQTARLEEIIAADENAMEFYIQSMWMNDGIERLSSGYTSKIDASKFENEINSPDSTGPDSTGSDSTGSDSTGSDSIETGDDDMVTSATQHNKAWFVDSNSTASKTKLLYAGVVVLASLLIATAILWVAVVEKPGTDPSDSLAQETKTQQAPQVALNVDSTDLDRQELADGTIVIARSGAKYSAVNAREILLDTGDLYLIVAKSNQPFVVKTSDGEVIATGTRFTVSANDKTKAAVAQGQVVLKSTAGTIEVGVGQEGTLAKAKQPTRGPALRLSYLVNWAKDALQQDELLVKPAARENGLIAIDPYGQEARLSLRKYNVDVYIEDGIARTTIDQTFFNHNPWNTEGTFYFPLPPDASVSRLAMYVAGQLNEGGMVSRERGQEIYTEILYQRRDPALLEMMEGNMFKMRIFPLEGRQEKRIFLSYTQNMEELYGTLKYWFPMDHTQDIANQLSIRVRVKDGAAQFDPGSSTHDVKHSTDGDDLVLEYAADKIKPDQDFLLNLLPKKDAPKDEVRVAICEHEGQNYLSARLLPDLTGDYTPEPRQWIVINDVSASRSKIDVRAQQHILERLIAEADDDDTVFLMDLNTKARNVSVKPVNVRSAGVKPLINHRPKRLIGATNIAAGLDAVQQVIRKHNLKNPHLVYLGDGVATDGEKALAELPRLIPNRCKFVGIGIGKKVDSMFLEEAANQTGGMYTTINPNEDIDWRVFDLLASLNTPRMSNIRVALLDENGQAMETIAYPSSTVIAAGETLTVTAMCDKKLPTKIQFTGQIAKRPVTKTALVKTAKGNAKYLPRLWAKQHIDDLLKSGMGNQEEIVALSKAFYVVTPFTSLIVLEDDAMYEEYDVERGRKDHWAMYDAPKTIDVVKEPVDWNRWGWGWGRFEGEDAKIEATTQPKTIQEIVDGVQVRINAPFYLWPEVQPDSRSGLYRICNSKLKSDSNASRWLTLWYLMASGQREAAVDWSRSGAASDGRNTGVVQPSDEGYQAMYGYARLPNSGMLFNQPGFGLRGSEALRDGRFRQLSQLSLVPMRESQLAMAREFMMPMQLVEEREQGISLDRIEPMREIIQLASTVPLSSGLNSNLGASFNRAVSNRWSRIQRDIKKYNSQYGGGRWNRRWDGGWSYGWNESIDLNGNNVTLWDGNGIQEILEDFESDDVQLMTQFNNRAKNPSVNFLGRIDAFDAFLPLQAGQSAVRGHSLIDDIAYGFIPARQGFGRGFGGGGGGFGGGGGGGFGGGGGGGFGGGGRSESLVVDSKMMLASRFFVTDGWQPQAMSKYNKPMHAGMFLAASQDPIRSQPGMAAVLAADYLDKRLTELKSKSVLDKRQLSEKKAIEIALSKIERVGASVESSGMFWGYSGWSYQPRPQTIQPPTIQAYSGYAWSYDLTRYADGLYSTGADMLDEVTKQYGKHKPLGKIDDDARGLIGDSRSNFQPVSIKYDDDAAEFMVGPNDRFAFEHRGEMYLTKKLICDGNNIYQIYDELGISARREATDVRINELRQLVPHMIAPADSLIEFFDVDLLERDDSSFTLKLTRAKNPIPNTEGAGSEKQAESAKTDSEKDDQPESYMLVTVDHQGRILKRSWNVGDATIVALAFNYDDEKIEIAWTLKTNKEDQTGTTSIQAKPFTPRDDTFKANLNQNVVIDMPLMKPSFYAQKITELTGAADADKAPDGEAEKKQPIPLKHGDEAVRLLRHQILASIQELSGNRWGQGNANAIALSTELVKLQERLKQTPKLGDVTLCGSAGVQIANAPEIRDRMNKHDSIKNSALYRFYQYRYNWKEMAKQFEDESELVGHIAAYNAAVYGGQDKQLDYFAKNFADSPLRLALVCSHHTKFKMDRLLDLNKDPRWAGVALLVAATRSGGPADHQKIADAFFEWQEELAKKDQQPVILDSVLRSIMSTGAENQKKMTKLLEQQLESIKKLDSLPVLMEFAERLSSWGQTKLADDAYSLAREKLGLNEKDADVPLLRRFAFGQSLWAGKRHKQAFEQFEVIMKSLDEKNISFSPAFCAAMARLAGQVGDHEQSVRLEEHALELEQPFLPDAINLSAFRQRYQWLWNQYVEAVKKIAKNDSDRDEKIDAILSRATKTWDRWQEVDRDNSALPGQMATLLKLADRKDDSWEFLSTVIDQKPKDANSYFQVGQWYRGQGNLPAATRWLGEAPQWDTANPQWLFHYGTALKELGRRSEAKVQFQKIINGKWAPALQHWVNQAKNEL